MALLLVAFGIAALVLYRPVLDAPLFSDDNLYTVGNPWVVDFSSERLVEIFDPRCDASKIVSNYAPVSLLLHVATWTSFGPSPRGHHVVNVLLHALVATLFVALLARAGLPDGLAAAGGLVFLLHPANVETVAWASQLKTLAATGLALSALLLLERRPALATLVFVLGLLTKATAAFAWPVAVAWLWTRRQAGADGLRIDPRRARWVGVWTLVFAAFAALELLVVARAIGRFPEGDVAETWVRLRSSLALVARYLFVAATSHGVSAFHEPPPATSPLDPWWLAGVLATGALGARTLRALRARSEEGVFWVWAAASFVPISQVVPFQYPMADRYLYAILPGLIGGTLLAGQGVVARLPLRPERRGRVATGLVVLVALVFGVRAWQRVPVWSDPAALMWESARNYPDGMNAALLESRQAAYRGDRREAVAALRRAYERGYRDISDVVANPIYATLRMRSDFRSLVDEMARSWTEQLRDREGLTQFDLVALANAHEIRGERELARRAFESALEQGGAYDPLIRQSLEALGSP
jgi:hypothetical protein